jgi:transposase-like protein
MAHSIETKNKAVKLRLKGYSIKEVAKTLSIATGTSSTWLRDIKLSKKAILRLKKRKLLGQYRARQTKKHNNQLLLKQIDKQANISLSKVNLNKETRLLLCSLLFWGEGSKTNQYVSFINSDPKMINVFITLLRQSYKLDETKFRALIHVHQYHNENQLKKYWSAVIKIPISQFSKSYLKPNTGKRKRNNYPGSLRIRYYDHKIAKDLSAIYNMFSRQIIK